MKSTNYHLALHKLSEMKAAGATEMLYTSQGRLLECTRNNFFLVKGGRLVTAADNILLGCTRGFVLELAQSLGIGVEEREVHITDLQEADEAFLTGTTKGVMPIVQVDESMIGNGIPGDVTQRLIDAFAGI